MTALIPAAVSSQLDDTGEERIHVAPIVQVNRPVYEGGGTCLDTGVYTYGSSQAGMIALNRIEIITAEEYWPTWLRNVENGQSVYFAFNDYVYPAIRNFSDFDFVTGEGEEHLVPVSYLETTVDGTAYIDSQNQICTHNYFYGWG